MKSIRLGRTDLDVSRIGFGGIPINRAKKRFKTQKARDERKNKIIKDHPEDIKYFIRFKYNEPITIKYIKKKLMELGINI